MIEQALRRPRGSYDTPTRQKQEYGARLRSARELAGQSLTDAAHALGYSQPVQLSNMENGNRLPPLLVLVECAKLYGTTMDYLCGLCDDSDRDPAVAAVRHVSRGVSSSVQRLIDVLVQSSITTVRKLLPGVAETQRLAGLTLEAAAALRAFRQRNKRFDDMPGGNALLSKAELAEQAARSIADQMARAQRVLQVRAVLPDGATPQVSLLAVFDAHED